LPDRGVTMLELYGDLCRDRARCTVEFVKEFIRDTFARSVSRSGLVFEGCRIIIDLRSFGTARRVEAAAERKEVEFFGDTYQLSVLIFSKKLISGTLIRFGVLLIECNLGMTSGGGYT
jgi:hypothetical protein